MRLAAQAKAGFYPTPEKVVEILKTWIGQKEPGIKRLLDPCCGTGEAAAEIAKSAECDAYGIEIHAGRAQQAKDRLKKVILGNTFSARAKHNSFSILFLNPPYDFDSEDGRTELSFLKHTIPYLAPRGILLFLIPQQRLTKRIARVLSATLTDARVRRFPEEEYKPYQQIVVAGIKKDKTQLDERSLEQLTTVPQLEIPEMTPSEASFLVPRAQKDFFIRSSEIAAEDLAEEIPQSSLWKEKEIEELFNPKDSQGPTKTLLPPRKAHLAMLIAAGMINNQVLDKEGQKLLIKGTSTKLAETFEEETENGKKITTRERIVTEINAFNLGTGEYLRIV